MNISDIQLVFRLGGW